MLIRLWRAEDGPGVTRARANRYNGWWSCDMARNQMANLLHRPAQLRPNLFGCD